MATATPPSAGNQYAMLRKTTFQAFARLLFGIGLAIVALYAYLYLAQGSIVFQPTALADDYEFQIPVPFEEVNIPVGGAVINAIHFRQEDPQGLIFFLHGNGGNLQSWSANADYYRRVNYDVLMIDYRGYGKSSGKIESEQQLHDDVRTAWDYIVGRFEGKPIVIYGRSLGTAPATRLARDVNPDLLVLVSPFSSVLALAREQYKFVPEWLVRFPLRTDRVIGEVAAPIMLLHGDRDSLIALQHSQTLAALAGGNARLITIEGAGHDDIHLFDKYVDTLTDSLPTR